MNRLYCEENFEGKESMLPKLKKDTPNRRKSRSTTQRENCNFPTNLETIYSVLKSNQTCMTNILNLCKQEGTVIQAENSDGWFKKRNASSGSSCFTEVGIFVKGIGNVTNAKCPISKHSFLGNCYCKHLNYTSTNGDKAACFCEYTVLTGIAINTTFRSNLYFRYNCDLITVNGDNAMNKTNCSLQDTPFSFENTYFNHVQTSNNNIICYDPDTIKYQYIRNEAITAFGSLDSLLSLFLLLFNLFILCEFFRKKTKGLTRVNENLKIS